MSITHFPLRRWVQRKLQPYLSFARHYSITPVIKLSCSSSKEPGCMEKSVGSDAICRTRSMPPSPIRAATLAYEASTPASPADTQQHQWVPRVAVGRGVLVGLGFGRSCVARSPNSLSRILKVPSTIKWVRTSNCEKVCTMKNKGSCHYNHTRILDHCERYNLHASLTIVC